MDYLHPVIARSLKHWTPVPPVALANAHLSYRNIDWRVAYDYKPAERRTWHEQGCDAHVEICEIYLMNGHDDLSDLISEPVKAEMEQKLLRQLEES